MNALESQEYQRLLAKLDRLPLAEQVTEWRGMFWRLAGSNTDRDEHIRNIFTRVVDDIEESGR